MNKQLLFNVLNRSLEGFYINELDIESVSDNFSINDYDVYIKFDISRFTIYDTVEKASFLLPLASISGPFDFYLYETSDIDFSSVSGLSSLNASDKGFNDDYVDHIAVT